MIIDSLLDRIYYYFEARRYRASKIVFKYRGAKAYKSTFEGFNTLFNNTVCVECELGKYSYVQKDSNLLKTKIGRFCSISDNVRTGFGKHPTTMVSTYPGFYCDTTSTLKQTINKGDCKIDLYDRAKSEDDFLVSIGNDVWIGSHVLIMDGVTIGDGAIIAAGAVVTKDVEPYAIYGGVPAKLIKYRFHQDIINTLLESCWWNKDDNWYRENSECFASVESLINRLNNTKGI